MDHCVRSIKREPADFAGVFLCLPSKGKSRCEQTNGNCSMRFSGRPAKNARLRADFYIKSCFGLRFFSRNVNSVNGKLEQRIERNEGSEKDDIRKEGKGGAIFT